MTRRRISISSASVAVLLALLVVTASCKKPTEQANTDPELQSLIWVLKLVDSGRGCTYIGTYLDLENVSCLEVPIGSTRWPMLVSKTGQRLDPRAFGPWYSMTASDFEVKKDDRGVFYVERHSGMAFRVVDGKLWDFWLFSPAKNESGGSGGIEGGSR